MSSAAPPALLLEQVQLLEGPDQPPVVTAVLLEAGAYGAQGEAARQRAASLGLTPLRAEGWLLAPCLVDPHSQLEDPWLGTAETLASLERSAIAAGYGTVALLPRARSWRDRPERLQPLSAGGALQWLLWGSFSRGGDGQELAGHGDQLAAGAIGLAEGEGCPPLPLLERGLSLGEFGQAPLLLAPRDAALSQNGFVREGVAALRAGWPPDPVVSETVPLQSLLALAYMEYCARVIPAFMPVECVLLRSEPGMESFFATCPLACDTLRQELLNEDLNWAKLEEYSSGILDRHSRAVRKGIGAPI